MNKISIKLIATYGLCTILGGIVVFHVLVIIGVVPSDIVWGGKLKDTSQMLVFESLSVFINTVMLAVVASHAGFVKWRIPRKLVRFALWAMFIIFLLNSIGNLLSENETEKMVFTPLTILLAFFSLILALSGTPKPPSVDPAELVN